MLFESLYLLFKMGDFLLVELRVCSGGGLILPELGLQHYHFGVNEFYFLLVGGHQ